MIGVLYFTEIFKSCRDALREYPGSNLYHWIQREGISTAVYAKCVKSVDGSYYALIDHDSESRRKVNGYDPKASYKRPFKYLINAFKDIVEFVNTSSSCRQHTKLECHNMRVSSAHLFIYSYLISYKILNEIKTFELNFIRYSMKLQTELFPSPLGFISIISQGLACMYKDFNNYPLRKCLL